MARLFFSDPPFAPHATTGIEYLPNGMDNGHGYDCIEVGLLLARLGKYKQKRNEKLKKETSDQIYLKWIVSSKHSGSPGDGSFVNITKRSFHYCPGLILSKLSILYCQYFNTFFPQLYWSVADLASKCWKVLAETLCNCVCLTTADFYCGTKKLISRNCESDASQ